MPGLFEFFLRLSFMKWAGCEVLIVRLHRDICEAEQLLHESDLAQRAGKSFLFLVLSNLYGEFLR